MGESGDVSEGNGLSQESTSLIKRKIQSINLKLFEAGDGGENKREGMGWVIMNNLIYLIREVWYQFRGEVVT